MEKKKQLKLSARDRGLVDFTRELIAISSPVGGEGEAQGRIAGEMEKMGWEAIRLDSIGNLHGRIGSGERVLAIDGHIDTVGPGEAKDWSCDPYRGKEEDGRVWGRGAVDQKGGVAAAVHAGRLFQEAGGAEGLTLRLVVSVQEEDCEGLAWDYLIEEEGSRPDAVVLTEPTDLKITRGQLGHCEFEISVRGRSAHAFCPEQGENAVYRAAGLIEKIRETAPRLASHPVFGRGRIAVTKISSQGPSDNSVPDLCRILIDRRFCPGEDERSLLAEIQKLSAGRDCDITIPVYHRASFTGKILEGRKFFPGWLLEEDAPLLRAARELTGPGPAAVGTWGFSTNGTSTMGKHGIPTIGFGPGEEALAHQPDERVSIGHLTAARDFYSALAQKYGEII
jgi:putative selenium metabolism hydrolase